MGAEQGQLEKILKREDPHQHLVSNAPHVEIIFEGEAKLKKDKVQLRESR